MITLPRLLKIGLPITTVATATVVTVSLICLYRNDDKDKRDLNNEELNDFENNLKQFEETTISYPEKPKQEGDSNKEESGDGVGKGSVEINLGEGGVAVLGADQASDEGGTPTEDSPEGIGLPKALGDEALSPEEGLSLGDSGQDISKEIGEGLVASSEEDEENAIDSVVQKEAMEDARDSLSDQNDSQEAQANVQEQPLSPQVGQAVKEQGSAAQETPPAQGEQGVQAVDTEEAEGPISEGIDSGGRGVAQNGIDPESTQVEESKNLEKEIKVFEDLEDELKLNRFKLDQALFN